MKIDLKNFLTRVLLPLFVTFVLIVNNSGIVLADDLPPVTENAVTENTPPEESPIGEEQATVLVVADQEQPEVMTIVVVEPPSPATIPMAEAQAAVLSTVQTTQVNCGEGTAVFESNSVGEDAPPVSEPTTEVTNPETESESAAPETDSETVSAEPTVPETESEVVSSEDRAAPAGKIVPFGNQYLEPPVCQ